MSHTNHSLAPHSLCTRAHLCVLFPVCVGLLWCSQGKEADLPEMVESFFVTIDSIALDLKTSMTHTNTRCCAALRFPAIVSSAHC